MKWGQENKIFSTMRLRGEKRKRKNNKNIILIICEIMILLKY